MAVIRLINVIFTENVRRNVWKLVFLLCKFYRSKLTTQLAIELESD